MESRETVEKWDKRFMALSFHIAEWSKDPYYKYGAIIVGDRRRVIGIGYNGLPRGIDDNKLSRYEEPDGHLYLEHAERNAIYNTMESLVSCTIYINGPMCADCARAVIQSGIWRVVVSSVPSKHPYKERRKGSNAAAIEMLKEADVGVFIL